MDRELEVDRYEEGPDYDHETPSDADYDEMERHSRIVSAWAEVEEAIDWDAIERIIAMRTAGDPLLMELRTQMALMVKHVKPLFEQLEEEANE